MGSGASKNRTESAPTKQPPTTRIETPATSLGSSAPTTPGGAAGPSDERDSSSFKVERTDDQYVIQFKPEEVTHDDINSSPSGSFPKKAAGEEGGSSVKGESFARRRLSVPDPKDLEKPLSELALREAGRSPDTSFKRREAALGDAASPPARILTASPKKKEKKSVSISGAADPPPPAAAAAAEAPESRSAEHAPSNKSPFRPERVGMYSKRGCKQGDDGQLIVKINQDRGCACSRHVDGTNVALFCVFDGHGQHGEHVSEFVMTRAQTLLLAHASIVSGPGDAIKASLLQTDAELMADPTVHSQRSGTTAVVVLLCKNQLWVGNVGDSRAVLGTLDAAGALVPHDLTIDHKPDDEGEFERITTCGGLVSEATPEDGPARVWFAPNSGHTSGPGLAMSRSIGDHRSRELGVIPEPDIRHHKLCKADKLVIIASDGVWEVMSSQAAVELVSTFTNATEACRALVREAVVCWQEEEGDVYRDDITAIVVFM